MGTFSHTSTYTHPVETVTAWHMRKGALTRATPRGQAPSNQTKALKKAYKLSSKWQYPVLKA
ncbi:Uncharacterised protein [Rothia dentocariosa]|uniref:Uncharacterized protein n=1 Tax=Rothia dentocariosa TaxID=2047 RepID=A0A448UX69_9MICC|nr:Uncharacterised protein [Rothia dentocariosa]